VGLQDRDLVLGGLGDADLRLSSGLGGRHVPPGAGWVRPEELSRVAEVARGRAPSGVAAGKVAVPPLRALLAEVTQRGWEHRGTRAVPSQLTRNYGRFTKGRGVVTADPGHAGYWVARTFPTTVLGEALIPEESTGSAFALAAALVAHHHEPWRPILAVLDGPLDDRGLELLEWTRSSAIPVVVEVWEPDAPALDEISHIERLEGARWSARSGGPVVLPVAPDGSQLDEMIDVAGPVTAWGGLPGSTG
jgi:hypothetical protein